MTHFKIETDPYTCICGIKLLGHRKSELPPKHNRIKIQSFVCGIKICSDANCRLRADTLYGTFGFVLHDNKDDVMSGRRGIIEPLSGCNTPGHITKKSPKKTTTHDPTFSVKMVNNNPAVCYFDGEVSNKVKQYRVQSKISMK